MRGSAKQPPRCIRENAGVSLQLLGCPSPMLSHRYPAAHSPSSVSFQLQLISHLVS